MLVSWYDGWLVGWLVELRVVLLFRDVYKNLLLLSFMSEAELSLTDRLPRESSFCLQNQSYLPRNVFILEFFAFRVVILRVVIQKIV